MSYISKQLLSWCIIIKRFLKIFIIWLFFVYFISSFCLFHKLSICVLRITLSFAILCSITSRKLDCCSIVSRSQKHLWRRNNRRKYIRTWVARLKSGDKDVEDKEGRGLQNLTMMHY